MITSKLMATFRMHSLKSTLTMALVTSAALMNAAALDTNSFAQKFNLTAASIQMDIAIGDLDGDGLPDLVAGNALSSSISVYRNISSGGPLGTNSFAPRFDLPVGTFPYSVILADVDGDGKLDIISGNNGNGGGNTISVLRNLGSPGTLNTNSFAARINFTVGTGPIEMAAADFDGDGKLDLVVGAYQSAGVSVLRNTGTPGVINASTFAPKVDFSTGAGVQDVQVADLDGDGKPDVAVANYNARTVSIFRNQATPGSFNTNSFAPKVNYATGDALGIGLSDLDGDGKPELVAGNHSSNNIFIYRNIGTPGSWVTSSFAPPVLFVTGSGPNIVAIKDVDHDGKPDLAISDYNDSRVSILKNTSVLGAINAGSFAPRVAFPSAQNPQMVLLHDLNGDNSPDLITASWGSSLIGISQNLLPPPVKPTLVQQPASQTILLGDSVTFTANATGSLPLNYQWFFEGQSLGGATGSLLLLTNVQLDRAGAYWVTVSNSAGSATSSNAVLHVDRAPIADAGATPTPILAPFSCDTENALAVVVLDGSRSSDPDGDALQYAWFQSGASDAIATGVVATVSLPVGTNHLTLVVSDGFASNSQAFTVEVITPATAIDRLMAVVRVDANSAQPLIASLRAALASINRCQPEVAINQLEALKNKILAQVAPLDPALANLLLAEVQAIIDALNGGASSPVALEITAIGRGNNGKPHMKIRGAAGRVHIIEASTDMVNWVKVGIAGCKGGCDYEFDDTQTPDATARFYRVVSPR